MLRLIWLWAVLLALSSLALAQDSKNGEKKEDGRREEKAQAEQAQPKPKAEEKQEPQVPPREEPEIEVVGKREYRAQSANSATRTDTDLFDTPASVQVIPRQLIEDQGAFELKDVYRNVSGVHPEKTQGFALEFEQSYIRGFLARRIRYNGFMTREASPVSLSNVETIEVLKGPASVLYGLIDPSGVISVTTKKPQDTWHGAVSAQAGSFHFYDASVDVSAPLTEDKTVLYRFNAEVMSTRSFRDFVEGERWMVAPSLTWLISPQTDLTIDLSYAEHDRTVDDGVAFSSTGGRVADIETWLGEPGHPGQQFEELYVSYYLDHRFSDAVEFRSAFRIHDWLNDFSGTRRLLPTPPTNTAEKRFEDGDFGSHSFQAVNDLVLKFDAGLTRHKVIAGVDLSYRDQVSRLRRGNMTPVSITDPVYGEPKPPITLSLDFAQLQTWVGMYLQDQITLTEGENLHLVLGARYDWLDTEDERPGGVETRTIDREFTGRAGLLYQPLGILGVYTSVGQSFLPSPSFQNTVSGEHLDPETGLGYEAGVKLDLFERKLSATFAVYEITKDDVAISDPANPGFSINGGDFQSRGFEFDVVGRVLPGLDAIASFAYIDTEVLESSSIPEGTRFRNIPERSGSLWLKYTIQEGPLENLGFGAGVFAASDRPGDDTDTFRLPGYGTVDAAIYYSYELPSGKPVRAGLIFSNIGDKEYYDSSFNTGRVNPGRPFSAALSVEIPF